MRSVTLPKVATAKWLRESFTTVPEKIRGNLGILTYKPLEGGKEVILGPKNEKIVATFMRIDGGPLLFAIDGQPVDINNDVVPFHGKGPIQVNYKCENANEDSARIYFSWLVLKD